MRPDFGWWWGVILLLGLPWPAAAQQIVTSAAPDTISVTVYRAPDRRAADEIDRDAPEGFALITETRIVHLPAGRATLRFEGVAGNIFSETAIISGLPQDVREKNLDADLLSPRSLYDRALGRRVMIRRTDKATGKIIAQQAIIRSGADGAAILQTGGGYEDLRCSGLPQALVYDAVPAGLSAKPTLSIETDNPHERDVTLTLSYLAGGFDWQADYVVRMRDDGKGADLFGWITLASSDVTSFANAGTQVIAGKPNRTADWSDFGTFRQSALKLKCWELPDYSGLNAVPPPPPPPPPVMEMASAVSVVSMEDAADIILTGSRVAKQEELGDFKLYRMPLPVTVAAKAQKQIALLARDNVPFKAIYVSDIYRDGRERPVLTLRAKNRIADGLGLPLPAGQVAVFESAAGRPMLVGEGATDDKAIGEDIEIKLDDTPQVLATIDEIAGKGRTHRYLLTVTNANPWQIAYEATITARSGSVIKGMGMPLANRDGKKIWAILIPANGAMKLAYQIQDPKQD